MQAIDSTTRARPFKHVPVLFIPSQAPSRFTRTHLRHKSHTICVPKRPSLPSLSRPQKNSSRQLWTCAQGIGPWKPAFEAAVLNTPVKPPSAPAPSPSEHTTRGLSVARLRRLLATTWRLASPFWRADKLAIWHGAACALFHVLDSSLGAVFTDVSGNLFTALNERDIPAFQKGSLLIFALCIVVVPLSACTSFIRQTLVIRWQQFLTKRGLHLYFEKGNFYRLANLKDSGKDDVDNPDEVIHEQFARFASNMVSLAMSNLRTVVEVVLYSIMLLRIFPPMYFIIIALVLAGTLLINHIGRRLVDLEALSLRRKADFRFALARIRIHSESIAFYNGSKCEHENAEGRLDAFASTKLELCKARFPVEMFTSSFYFLPIILPLLVLGPLYFTGRIQLGELTKAETAFNVLFGNLSMFIGDYDHYAWLGASIERLSRFISTLEERLPFAKRDFKIEATRRDDETPIADLHRSTGPVAVPSSSLIHIIEDENEHGLQLDHVCVDTPGGERRIVEDLSLTVRPGEKLLIVGPSGRGKTSLLRAIAGLWTAGSGTIRQPKRSGMLFLPQRAYCVQGSLRRQLEYPGERRYPDAELMRALERVELGELCGRVGGLDASRDWSEYLSVGEMQRVAFARAVLCKARVVLVDEGTAGVDLRTERVLMRVLGELGCAVVSVGHRGSLVGMHERVLVLADGGCARVVDAADYSASA